MYGHRNNIINGYDIIMYIIDFLRRLIIRPTRFVCTTLLLLFDDRKKKFNPIQKKL